jgi:hypothetical protein
MTTNSASLTTQGMMTEEKRTEPLTDIVPQLHKIFAFIPYPTYRTHTLTTRCPPLRRAPPPLHPARNEVRRPSTTKRPILHPLPLPPKRLERPRPPLPPRKPMLGPLSSDCSSLKPTKPALKSSGIKSPRWSVHDPRNLQRVLG